MAKAVICPVCGGSGKVMSKPDAYGTSAATSATCHGCGGLGWVQVAEDTVTEVEVAYGVNPEMPG